MDEKGGGHAASPPGTPSENARSTTNAATLGARPRAPSRPLTLRLKDRRPSMTSLHEPLVQALERHARDRVENSEWMKSEIAQS